MKQDGMGQSVWKNPREAAISELASTGGWQKGVWKPGVKWNPAHETNVLIDSLLCPLPPTIHIFHIVDQIITS